MNRAAAALLCLSACTALLRGAGAITVTNHAGRAVSGEFGGVTNGFFILSGRAYPLSALPGEERARLLALAGRDVRSAREKAIDRDLAYQLARIGVREKEGEISAAEASALRADARAAAEFRRRAAAGARRSD